MNLYIHGIEVEHILQLGQRLHRTHKKKKINLMKNAFGDDKYIMNEFRTK